MKHPMDLADQVLKEISSREEEIVQLTSQLVQIPSLTGMEGQAQTFMIETLSQMNFELDVWEPDLEQLRQHPEFQQIPDDYDKRPNVVGILKGTGGGKSIILNGHIDVVPVEPIEQWDHGGPWCGLVVGDRLYGRGSSDMKGGLACFIHAVKTLQDMGIKLKGDVILQSVVDEERGGNGTLAAVLRGYKADYGIIGEPTNMTITTDNAGALWVRITITGKAAHGAYKEYGVNAIEKAMFVYQNLVIYETERHARLTTPQFAHYRHPFPLNIGMMRAGDWPSSVPDIAVMEGRVGFSPAEDHNQFRREFEAEVARIARVDPWLAEHPPKVEWFGLFMDSARIDHNHPLVHIAQEAARNVLGREMALKGKAGGTDMRLLIKSGTPCLQIGPGLSVEAHTINESVPIQNLVDVTKMVALILLRACEIS
jgi:acetylornithine deacetylase